MHQPLSLDLRWTLRGRGTHQPPPDPRCRCSLFWCHPLVTAHAVRCSLCAELTGGTAGCQLQGTSLQVCDVPPLAAQGRAATPHTSRSSEPNCRYWLLCGWLHVVVPLYHKLFTIVCCRLDRVQRELQKLEALQALAMLLSIVGSLLAQYCLLRTVAEHYCRNVRVVSSMTTHRSRCATRSPLQSTHYPLDTWSLSVQCLLTIGSVD